MYKYVHTGASQASSGRSPHTGYPRVPSQSLLHQPRPAPEILTKAHMHYTTATYLVGIARGTRCRVMFMLCRQLVFLELDGKHFAKLR